MTLEFHQNYWTDQNTLKDTKCKIKFLGSLPENLNIFKDVQQWDSLS